MKMEDEDILRPGIRIKIRIRIRIRIEFLRMCLIIEHKYKEKVEERTS